MDYMDNIENSTSFLDDIEEDPFNPYEYEMNTYEKIYHFLLEYLVSIAHILICVAILFASALLFWAFYKFKPLHTRTNYYLLSFYISITLSSVLFTLTIIIGMFINFSIGHHITLITVLALSLLNSSFIFALLLAQDWILAACNTRLSKKYQSYYKWMIGGVYLFVLSHFILFFIYQYNHIVSITIAMVGLSYLVNGLVIGIFNIIRYKKRFSEESKQILYALNVASVYFLIWLPPAILIIINILFSLLGIYSFSLVVIMSCVTYFFEFISFSGPVIIVYLLPKWDKNFKMAYDYVFKTSFRNYEQAEDDV